MSWYMCMQVFSTGSQLQKRTLIAATVGASFPGIYWGPVLAPGQWGHGAALCILHLLMKKRIVRHTKTVQPAGRAEGSQFQSAAGEKLEQDITYGHWLCCAGHTPSVTETVTILTLLAVADIQTTASLWWWGGGRYLMVIFTTASILIIHWILILNWAFHLSSKWMYLAALQLLNALAHSL